MVKMKFIYMNNKYEMDCDKNSRIIDIIRQYAKLFKKSEKLLLFIYNGQNLLLNKKRKIIELNTKKCIMVFDFSIKSNVKKDNINNIICPICEKLSIFKLNGNTIISENCSHDINHFLLNKFIDCQNNTHNINDIICSKCKNINKFYNNDFYICSSCDYICPLCYSLHDKTHTVIEYSKRFSFCNKHNMKFTSFCSKCKTNLCPNCEDEKTHKNHKIIYLKEIRPNNKKIEEIQNELNDIDSKIEKSLNEVKFRQLITITLLKNFEDYLINFQTINRVLILYTTLLNNYEIIENVNNIFSIKIKRLDSFLEGDVKNKYLYKIDKGDDFLSNYIDLIYKSKYERNFKLFDEKFIKKNKNHCHLIINGKYSELCQFYKISNKKKKPKEYIYVETKVRLFSEKPIIDMSYMFNECDSLVKVSFNKYDTSKTINMSKMFCGCLFLELVEGLIYTNNVENMSHMFENCSYLYNINSICIWNTSKVKDISYFFNNCTRLKFLPEILNWDTHNIRNMSYMFSNCISLDNLPNISKWNTSNVINMSNMFNKCTSLDSLPDISKWNTNNVTDMSCMFCECIKLSSLPDISNWNTNNVINMEKLFCNCESLSSLPDISRWNTQNVSNMKCMFYYCALLSSLPDISKWNCSKVNNMDEMFYKCKSVKALPDIDKWDMSKIKNIKDMFFGCTSLLSFPTFYNKKNVK